MDVKSLSLLQRKQFLHPESFSKDDEMEMERLKNIVYSSDCDQCDDITTTPESNTSSVINSLSSNSTQSEYTKNVLTNRFFKEQFSVVTLEALSPFLDDCRNHFQTAANFHAVFLNFIRYLFLMYFCWLCC
jgi:hypothetical protein